MPFVQDYTIYCDECFLHHKIAFAFGGLICTTRAEILKKKLIEIRSELNYVGELKWVSIRCNNLYIFEKFIDVFLNGKFPCFSIMKVEKDSFWKTWGRTEEERFFMAYYKFLKWIASSFYRFEIYLDDKTLDKSYRWKTLHHLINLSRKNNWSLKGRNVTSLQPIDSSTDDLIQLADILLGCLLSNSTSKAKTDLQNRVKRPIVQEKFQICNFRPNLKSQV